MQTNLADFIKSTPEGREAQALFGRCVRCGFCIATCPTYQVLGDERDSPRGRIDLIKQSVEGRPITTDVQLHLDRCLTCRLCETTCPSGVQFGRLIDLGRHIVEQHVRRGFYDSVKRKLLRSVVPHSTRFGGLLKLAQRMRAQLPASLQRKVPAARPVTKHWPQSNHARKMLALDGCVQPTLSPDINAAAAHVLDRLGITLTRAPNAGCCGALSFHLAAQQEAREFMKRNIDAWWPHIEQGAEAIVMTASGCGVMVQDYGRLLADDPAYAAKALRVTELSKDISQIIAAEQERLSALIAPKSSVGGKTIAFHAPCTLQHGLKLAGTTEALLTKLGFELTPVTGAHLCCGSAGTYSILQPQIAERLLENKIKSLTAAAPCAILTANIGCQSHLQSATDLPVKHWIVALEEKLAE